MRNGRGWVRRSRALGRLGLGCAVLGAILASAQTAHAWKPIGHVYFAQQALEDAKDGKVSFDIVDYETGKILKSLGEFEVDKTLYEAINAFPQHFYAGVLGPDAYPDILMGQNLIHPPGSLDEKDKVNVLPDVNAGGPGSDFWLQRLWNVTQTGTCQPTKDRPEVTCNSVTECKGRITLGDKCTIVPDATLANQAFVLGYFAHAAGDVYGHTFVNNFTGGLFNLTEPLVTVPSLQTAKGMVQLKTNNAIRHITLEGYIYRRMPELALHAGKDIYEMVKASGVDNGVDKFIAKYLDPSDIGRDPGGESRKSFQWHFGQLEKWLQEFIDAYHAKVASYEKSIDGLEAQAASYGKQAEACSWSDMSCSSIKLRAQQALKLGEVLLEEGKLYGYQAVTLPRVKYSEAWIDDIEDGLREWPLVSHRVAMELMFTKDPTGTHSPVKGAKAHLSAFQPQLMKMLGVPDAIVAIAEFLKSLTIPVPFKEEWEEFKGKIEKNIANHLVKEATGLTLDDFELYFKSPEQKFDAVFSKQTYPDSPYEKIRTSGLTVKNLNELLKVDDKSPTGYGEMQKKLNWKEFPAGYNTVTMIKLSMLGRKGMIDLLGKLGVKVCTTAEANGSQKSKCNMHESELPGNAMLGFADTIDGSNQWNAGSHMVVARSCTAYKQLFMKQPTPKRTGMVSGVPLSTFEPDDVCGPKPNPVVLSQNEVTLAPGATVAVKYLANGSNAVVHPPRTGFRQVLGTVTSDANGFTYTAPMLVPAERDVSLVVTTASSAVKSTFRVHLMPTLSALPATAMLTGGGKQTFDTNGTVATTWSVVTGSGKVGDPAVRKAFEAEIAAHEAKVKTLDSDIYVAGKAAAACSFFDISCRQKAQEQASKAAAAKSTYLVQSAPKIAAAIDGIAKDNATYYAPSTVSKAEDVVIKGVANDGSGRTVTATVHLDLPPPALTLAEQPPTVKVGDKVTIKLAQSVPLTWKVISGGGSVGSKPEARHTSLRASVLPLNTTLAATRIATRERVKARIEFAPRTRTALAGVLPQLSFLKPSRAPASSARQVAAPDALRQLGLELKAESDKRAKEAGDLTAQANKVLAAAFDKKLEQEIGESDNTYFAPASVTRPMDVVLEATANDGTGRKLQVTVKVLPK